VGFWGWDELHPVAVLSISRLIGALDRLRSGLEAHEGGEERGRFLGFPHDSHELPGRAGGVAVVVEVEMPRRAAGKAREGIDSAGGQGGGAATCSNPTAVLTAEFKSNT